MSCVVKLGTCMIVTISKNTLPYWIATKCCTGNLIFVLTNFKASSRSIDLQRRELSLIMTNC